MCRSLHFQLLARAYAARNRVPDIAFIGQRNKTLKEKRGRSGFCTRMLYLPVPQLATMPIFRHFSLVQISSIFIIASEPIQFRTKIYFKKLQTIGFIIHFMRVTRKIILLFKLFVENEFFYRIPRRGVSSCENYLNILKLKIAYDAF